ncbi:hypothetical protein BH11ARM2_BH11ARM2_00810 [soil metagenome]
MVKAYVAGRELQRLTLILLVAGVAIMAVPAVRLWDAVQANQEMEARNQRISDVRQMRTQGRMVISRAQEGAMLATADVKPRLMDALQSFRDARTKAAGDGVRVLSADFEPAVADFQRKALELEDLPQTDWKLVRLVQLSSAFARVGSQLDNHIAQELEVGAGLSRSRETYQYAFLALAFLLTFGLAIFVFAPTLKAVREAFHDLDLQREEAGRTASERGAILSATTYAVLAVDADGLIRSANPAAGHMFRCEQIDLEGRRLEGLLGDRGPELVRSSVEGRTVETELRTMRLDGSDAPVAVSMTPMEGGRFLAIVRDLSDREEVHQRLAEEQARSRSLLESIPDTIVRLDENGKVTEYRPNAELDFVTHPDALQGRSLETALPASAAIPYRRARASTMSGSSASFVFTANLQERKRHVEARLSPMHDGGALVLLRDVTERDEAIANLRRSEQTLAATQSAARLGSWEIDPVSRRVGFSKSLRELLNLYPGDPETVETFMACLAPESRDRLQTAMDATERDGNPYDLVLKFVRGDGRSFDCRCQGGPREDRLLNIVQDVTEQLRQQDELVTAREAAERGAKAKSEFLANMSHEIRTPMNGVIGVVYLLQGTDLSPRQRIYADAIQKSGENLLHLVSDVLDLSKIESGKMTLEMKEFSLGDVARQITDVFSPGAREKGVCFECYVDPALPERVMGDAVRMNQVVANLVGNAVKFTGHGGVTLSVRVLGKTSHGVSLELKVADSGIGIPSDQLDSIFESFVQADGTTTRRFGGTGLGLAITKQLVGLMGGVLSVQSRDGEGSEFTVTLDMGVPALSASTIAPVVEAPGLRQGVRILLAEDNAVNQMVVRDLLSARGCVVETALDGAIAVQMALDRPFDLILMDVQMPHMDGYEATRRLRDLGLTTPIVAMTANALEGDRERCLAAGMDDYLPKPVRPPHLLAAVARWTTDTAPPPPIPTMDRNDPMPALFDPTRLAEMFGEGDPALRFVLKEWIRTSPPLLQQVTGSDPSAARAAAHALKGASRTIGANAIGDACEAFEKEGTSEAAGKVAEIFPATVQALEAELNRIAV